MVCALVLPIENLICPKIFMVVQVVCVCVCAGVQLYRCECVDV